MEGFLTVDLVYVDKWGLAFTLLSLCFHFFTGFGNQELPVLHTWLQSCIQEECKLCKSRFDVKKQYQGEFRFNSLKTEKPVVLVNTSKYDSNLQELLSISNNVGMAT